MLVVVEELVVELVGHVGVVLVEFVVGTQRLERIRRLDGQCHRQRHEGDGWVDDIDAVTDLGHRW